MATATPIAHVSDPAKQITVSLLAGVIQRAQEAAQPYLDELAAAKQELADLLASEPSGKYAADQHIVTVTRTRRFDAAAAAKKFPAADFPKFYTTTPVLDRKELEANIAPTLLADCFKESSPSLKITAA